MQRPDCDLVSGTNARNTTNTIIPNGVESGGACELCFGIHIRQNCFQCCVPNTATILHSSAPTNRCRLPARPQALRHTLVAALKGGSRAPAPLRVLMASCPQRFCRPSARANLDVRRWVCLGRCVAEWLRRKSSKFLLRKFAGSSPVTPTNPSAPAACVRQKSCARAGGWQARPSGGVVYGGVHKDDHETPQPLNNLLRTFARKQLRGQLLQSLVFFLFV